VSFPSLARACGLRCSRSPRNQYREIGQCRRIRAAGTAAARAAADMQVGTRGDARPHEQFCKGGIVMKRAFSPERTIIRLLGAIAVLAFAAELSAAQAVSVSPGEILPG